MPPIKEDYCPQLGEGWIVQVYARKASARGASLSGNTYKIFQAPDGTRFKSMVQAQAYLVGPSCIACGSGDDTAGNDILLCDTRGCKAAWHMACLDEPLTEVAPSET